jgi:hypothetical protein
MKMPSPIKTILRRRETRFTVPIPAAQQDVEKYYEVLAKLFGQEIIPPLDFLKAIPQINPYGLIIIADKGGTVLGGMD